MKIMKTNCINCGAPLSSDGYCKYCNTKIRYANEIELPSGTTGRIGNNIDVLIKYNNEYETILLPLKGRMSIETIFNNPGERTEVSLIFYGYIDDDERN